MLTIDQLEFRYSQDSFHLKLAHFSAARGEATALVGPSGCGKTSLLQIASGILTPQSGTVTLDDQPVLTDPEFRLENIGLIFQEFELVPHLSVRDNILLPFHLGLKKTRPDPTIITEKAGISQHLNRLPTKLSQGERQRVAICRALITRPRLILADEPTGNLDPDNKHAILQLLLSTACEQNCPLVVATHDHELLESFDHVHSFSDLTQS